MTDEPLWHWTEAGQPAGPGTRDQLSARIAAVALGPGDRVWTAGMADWLPPDAVPSPAAHRPLGYASAPVGPLPPRAAATLAAYARPLGDPTDWPLDDDRLDQLAAAARVRRRLTAAAGWYRVAFWTFAVAGGYGSIAALADDRRRGPAGGTDRLAAIVVVALVVGVAALLWAVGTVTRRTCRWGAITMLVLCLLATAGLTVGAIAVLVGPRHAHDGLPGLAVTAAVFAWLSFVSARAIGAAGAFRRQPAWCQEVLVRVEQRR